MFSLIAGLAFGYILGSAITSNDYKKKLIYYFTEKGYIEREAIREVEFIINLNEEDHETI